MPRLNQYAVFCSSDAENERSRKLAEQLSLPYLTHYDDAIRFVLSFTENRLTLCDTYGTSKPIYVDFLSGKAMHRHKYGQGKETILKACGVKAGRRPTILDATAGLGGDAFILATAGCDVLMLERSPIIAALLQDACQRLAMSDTSCALRFLQEDALCYLEQHRQSVDVIYLDPMYPDLASTALPRKEMRLLRDVVGSDDDVSALFHAACLAARSRVVVKRPNKAPPIAQNPTMSFPGSSTRFDVYIIMKG